MPKKTAKTSTYRATTLQKFETEALFLQAIAGLFMRIPGIEGVQIPHGAQEFGKDLVFWTTGPLGERIACACVLKRDRISGNASRSSGARTVFHQVEQALDTPYTDGSGQDILVQRIYVLTPNHISTEAINSIRGSLRNRAGQIIFLSGHDIFRLFRQYWPDFYSDEAAALERYLDRMRSHLHQHGPLERLAGFYDLGTMADVTKIVHVPLDLERNLNNYNIISAINSLLLQPSQAKPLPNEKLLSEFHDQAQTLRRLISHLSTWGLCPTSSNMATAITHYIQEVVERWQMVEEREKPILSLEKKRDSVKALIDHELTSLYKYQAKTIPLIAKKTFPRNILGSSIFQEALFIDQCLSEFAGWRDVPVFRSLTLTGRQWRKTNESIIVAGEPGSGKTSFCKWNALQDIESYSVGKSDTLPIYLPLQTLSDTASASLSDLVGSAAPFSAFLGDVRTQLEGGKFARVRLYCDGLDEISSHERRLSLIKTVQMGATEDPRFQIILTTRNYVRGHELAWLPRFHIKGLDDLQFRNLCNQWLGSDAVVRNFLTQLQGDPHLAELTRIPLLATLTILVFRRTGRLPDNKGKLYSMFVELLAGGWDLAKGVLRPSRFGRDVKLIVLARLAENLHRSRRRIFGIQDIFQAAKETFINPNPVLETRWEFFANELLEDGLLTPAGESLRFQFKHLSFQEYLAARELLSSPDSSRATSALVEFLNGDGWWKEVMNFYILISGNPRELWEWIKKARVTGSGPSEYLRRTLLGAYPKFNPD